MRAPCLAARLIRGFTLLELLLVIAVIAALAGLLFPVISSVQDRARKTQAQSDLQQLILACKAFETEYGRLPVDDTQEFTYGAQNGNEKLLRMLRTTVAGKDGTTFNAKQVVFFEGKVASASGKGGILAKATIAGGEQNPVGSFVDPWGKQYRIRLDAGYVGAVANPYAANAGPNPLPIAIIAWSHGKDQQGGDGTASGDKAKAPYADDVISWQ